MFTVEHNITLKDLKGGLVTMEHTTRVVGKQYSPLYLVKTAHNDISFAIGIISDVGVTEEDIKQTIEKHCQQKPALIQDYRNIAGAVTTDIVQLIERVKKGSCEGVGVLLESGDFVVSSLYGDMMNHAMCRDEFYALAYHAINRTNANATLVMRKYNILRGWPIWIVTRDVISDTQIVDSITNSINDESTLSDIRKVLTDVVEMLDNAIIFAYVDKAWIFVNKDITPEEFSIASTLLTVSPHV